VQALRLVELIADRCSTAVPLLINLGALRAMVGRLQVEIGAIKDAPLENNKKLFLKVLLRSLQSLVSAGHAIREASTGPLPATLKTVIVHSQQVLMVERLFLMHQGWWRCHCTHCIPAGSDNAARSDGDSPID